jgi:hypothetical protein
MEVIGVVHDPPRDACRAPSPVAKPNGDTFAVC